MNTFVWAQATLLNLQAGASHHMSDHEQENHEHNAAPDARDARIEERRNRHTKRSGSDFTRKLAAGGIGIAATIAFPLVVFGPAAVSDFFFGHTTETQDASQFDLEVSSIAAQVPQAEPEPTIDPNADADRIAALEALVKKLSEQKQGMTEEELKKLLAKQQDEFRKQAEAEKLRMAAEMKRLEEERLRKEALAKQAADLRKLQTESKSVIVDGSSGGSGGGGTANGADLSDDQKFLDSAADGKYEIARAKSVGDTSKIIVQGTIISAVLETAINTELPGNIRAQVTEPVFSYDGEQILLPAGTRLVGTFNNDINTAQKRVLIAWNRAITPDGQSINIGSTGTDSLGRSGTGGNVDNRFMERYGAAALISTISAVPSIISAAAGVGSGGASLSGGGLTLSTAPQVDPTTGALVQAGTSAADSIAEASSGALEERLALPPIIRVPQGEDIRVFVNRDLVF
jgi:type IV secretion system protein VirB10